MKKWKAMKEGVTLQKDREEGKKEENGVGSGLAVAMGGKHDAAGRKDGGVGFGFGFGLAFVMGKHETVGKENGRKFSGGFYGNGNGMKPKNNIDGVVGSEREVTQDIKDVGIDGYKAGGDDNGIGKDLGLETMMGLGISVVEETLGEEVLSPKRAKRKAQNGDDL
jgi:CubicO group peptidase (beta-lactamase class C family)